jgi:uncharacterized phage-like protein YoqJ
LKTAIKGKIVCGTGHRLNKLGGYSPSVLGKIKDFAIETLELYKPAKIISGMALGWDTALAEAAVELNIPYIAAVPFIGQERMWPKKSQEYYFTLLEKAVEKVIVSDGYFSVQKMQIRNEWMVDHSEHILALWDGTPGGTSNCITYALTLSRPIINVWKNWIEFKQKEEE